MPIQQPKKKEQKKRGTFRAYMLRGKCFGVTGRGPGIIKAECQRKKRRLVDMRSTRIQQRRFRRTTGIVSGKSGKVSHYKHLLEEVGGVALRWVRGHIGDFVDCDENFGD